jgi:hypothetical protein
VGVLADDDRGIVDDHKGHVLLSRAAAALERQRLGELELQRGEERRRPVTVAIPELTL